MENCLLNIPYFKAIKVLYFFQLIMIFYQHPLMASEPLVLTFSDLSEESTQLSSFNQQVVHIRGFLYALDSTTLILASQPNLKSCCIGSQSKIRQQIIIRNMSEPFSDKALTIKGLFKIEPLYAEDGSLKQLYVLEQAQIVPEKQAYAIWLIVALGCLISFALFRLFRSRLA